VFLFFAGGEHRSLRRSSSCHCSSRVRKGGRGKDEG
jgi:hypothetical protein